ncbi:MAG: dTDP-4-dehydrorhamnose 3,5-epimerase [Campylobacterota bacterium]|nr:dTDP-4-dehydrorhamnose 3,5-epimerase [Campylobacterota bacterium]
MKFIKTDISDVIIIEPIVFADDRGYFVETFREDKLEEAIGHSVDFVQDNESKSTYGVLRGLHFQLPPFAQSKLVRVINGKILDIAVDIRKGSPTFGKYVSIELSEENKRMLFIPRGFAHGFVVLSEEAIFSYKVDNYYSKEFDRGIAFNDPTLNIEWQLDSDALRLSVKDQMQPLLANADKLFDYGENLYG